MCGPQFLGYIESAQCLRFSLLKPVLSPQDASAREKHAAQDAHVDPRVRLGTFNVDVRIIDLAFLEIQIGQG